jgi:hypothetical protein
MSEYYLGKLGRTNENVICFYSQCRRAQAELCTALSTEPAKPTALF